jgi:translation initiation factor 4B
VQDVRVIRHQDTQKPKGAFITLADADGCARALSRNNGMLLGRPMRVDVAEARPERSSGGACCTACLHGCVRALCL